MSSINDVGSPELTSGLLSLQHQGVVRIKLSRLLHIENFFLILIHFDYHILILTSAFTSDSTNFTYFSLNLMSLFRAKREGFQKEFSRAPSFQTVRCR